MEPLNSSPGTVVPEKAKRKPLSQDQLIDLYQKSREDWKAWEASHPPQKPKLQRTAQRSLTCYNLFKDFTES